MPIPKSTAKKQVNRLSSTQFFESLGESGFDELVATLASISADEEMAKCVVTSWLDEHSERPAPADLRRIASAYSVQRSADGLPPGCDDCRALSAGFMRELNWRRHKRVMRSPITGAPEEYDFAERCHCNRGRQLAAMDAERNSR